MFAKSRIESLVGHSLPTGVELDLARRIDGAFEVTIDPSCAYEALYHLVSAFSDLPKSRYALDAPCPIMRSHLDTTVSALGVGIEHATAVAPASFVFDGLDFESLRALATMRHPTTDVRGAFLCDVADFLFDYLRVGEIPEYLVGEVFEFGIALDNAKLCGLLAETHAVRGLALWQTCAKVHEMAGFHPWYYVLAELLRSGADPYSAVSEDYEAPIIVLISGPSYFNALLVVKVFWPHEPLGRNATVNSTPPYKATLEAVVDANLDDNACLNTINELEGVSRWRAVLMGLPPRLGVQALTDGLVDPLPEWRTTLHMADKATELLYRGAIQPIHKASSLWTGFDIARWKTFLLVNFRLNRMQKLHVNRDATAIVATFFHRTVKP